MQTMLKTYDRAKDYGKLAFETEVSGFPVRIYQNEKRNGSFAVQYGKQMDHHLSYSDACSKLGEALLHGLACEGLVDNEMN